MSPKVTFRDGSLPESAVKRLQSRAAKYGTISFVLSLIGTLAGAVTGIAIPITTNPAVVTGQGGYTWSHRAWTPATEAFMWIGYGVTAIICIAALAIGLTGRHLRSVTEHPETRASFLLTPRADLGIAISLTAPLTVFASETISMLFVTLLS